MTDPTLYRFLAELGARVRPVQDMPKLLRATLRATLDLFAGAEGAVAVRRRGSREAEMVFVVPRSASFDLKLLDEFIRRRRPEVPRDLILGPVRRRGLPWAVLAIRRPGGSFARGDGRLLAQVTAAVSQMVEARDRQRLFEVRERIDRKLMEELRPKDVFYQILHGLRSLTHYDHSSALLAAEGDSLELVAEQIAWSKAKSQRIGLRLPLDESARRALAAGVVCGLDRNGDDWLPWRGSEAGQLARLLDYNRDPREGALLYAPLATDEGLFGVLKVSAREPGTFGAWDGDLLERFVPQAAIAIQHARRAVSLEERLLLAERKHAMAELARGVSHDINNALGAVLPLVQQMQSDLADGRFDPVVIGGDLEQVHTSLQVCRRIFGGMLAFARGTERRLGPTDLRQAAKNALTVLGDGIARRGIRLELAIADGLPSPGGSQADLEQLFLNLFQNARDAMPGGGVLTIRARPAGAGVEVVIEDTGLGIAPDILPRIHEPFFTTKRDGDGLGLSICRSIVWELGGDLDIRSQPGHGTRVEFRLPARSGHGQGEARGEVER